MHFFHYFSKKRGPFRSISDLPEDDAQKIWNSMIDYLEEKNGVNYKRVENVLIFRRHEIRKIIEADIRRKFAEKGGKILRKHPYYMVLTNRELPNKNQIEFYENGDFIEISIEGFDMRTVSFTYGDSMQYLDPSSYEDGMYENKVFTYEEIVEIIKEYGWESEEFNLGKGKPGFIEVQLWSDKPIIKYRE